MVDETFLNMLGLAKCESNHLVKLVKKYEALIIKYSIINGTYHEDLHSQLVETTIKAVKNFRCE